MKLSIIIPTHNEAGTIAQVLQGLLDLELSGVEKDIIVVDDGSTDRTAAIARSKGVRVVTHLVNRGLGGALGTGIEAALRAGADVMITFDADGQHATEDISPVIRPILMGQADAVIGSRMLGGPGMSLSQENSKDEGQSRDHWKLKGGGMPWRRRMANRVANVLTWIFFGIRTTDSQSGLRAFSHAAAKRFRITTNNYEVSSEICGEIGRHRLRLAEVPIRSIYTDYSLSKGQSFFTGIKTLLRLILTVDGRSR